MSLITDTRLQSIRLINTIMQQCFNAGILAQSKATTSLPIPFIAPTSSDPSHPFHELMESCSINELRSILFDHLAVLSQGTSTLLDLAAKLDPSLEPQPQPQDAPQPQPEGEPSAHVPGPSGSLPPLSET